MEARLIQSALQRQRRKFHGVGDREHHKSRPARPIEPVPAVGVAAGRGRARPGRSRWLLCCRSHGMVVAMANVEQTSPVRSWVCRTVAPAAAQGPSSHNGPIGSEQTVITWAWWAARVILIRRRGSAPRTAWEPTRAGVEIATRRNLRSAGPSGPRSRRPPL